MHTVEIPSEASTHEIAQVIAKIMEAYGYDEVDAVTTFSLSFLMLFADGPKEQEVH